MALSTGAEGSDAHAFMANVAARFMGRKPAPALTATLAALAAPQATPRTMPLPQVVAPDVKATAPHSKPNPAPPAVKKENVPPPPPQIARPKSVPSIPEQDVELPEVNKGPSLRGTADQLKVSSSLAESRLRRR